MEKIITKNYDSNKSNVLTKTEDYFLYTETSRLIDLQMGNSAFVFGYSFDKVKSAIKENNLLFARHGENETSKVIRKVTNEILDGSKMSGIGWTVSGTDAVETAIAMNHEYWKNVDPSRTSIVSFLPNYHGSSYLTRSLRKIVPTDICKYVEAPMWVDINHRANQETNTLSMLEDTLKDKTIGAVIVESIPWVCGLYPFSSSFWERLNVICEKADVNLILDDVAGCFGKTGFPFSHIDLKINADIVAIGKSLTGGYSPLGATLYSEKICSNIDPHFDHNYTYNPNVNGVVAAGIVLEEFTPALKEKAKELNSKLCEALNSVGVQYRHEGVIFDLIYNSNVFIEKLQQTFSFNAYNENSIPGVVPYIADDMYFELLKQGLK